MTHWGWYWRIKKKHKPKKTCFALDSIDSFDMFKNKEGIAWVKSTAARIIFEIFRYNLIARLLDDDSIAITSNAGSQLIRVEKMPCNYGGTYQFFHCPQCDKRMRKLYLVEGKYLCRKCATLGYYSQRLRPSERHLYMLMKVEKDLKNRAGSLESKPPWVKRYTFQKLRKKYLDYDAKYFYSIQKELDDWYPERTLSGDNDYSMFVPSGFLELYDYKD